MFEKTRLKLTAWYLLIIMLISFTFSAVIFNVQMVEVERFARAQRTRFERQYRPDTFFVSQPFLIDPDLVAETQKHLLSNLLIINSIIIIISGGFGYFLAGKTLRPIKEMVDDQDRFISDSSHELKTPLTSLKSAMEVALMDKTFTLVDAKKLIKENIADVDRLHYLSESLINLSRNKEQNGNSIFENISLSIVIESAIKKILPQANNKKIVIKKSLVNTDFCGDKEKIENLITILLENAVKYSSSNKTILIKTAKTNKTLSFSVTDHGQGISKKDLPFIFDRFYRADPSRSRSKAPGFGLGLSIAKMIVEKHHGEIGVKSRLGHGSMFIVTLPRNVS
ncbi:sensor histidine kinase [bacterium]|nr:MAG: sensor histidine kinase [bacterium]